MSASVWLSAEKDAYRRIALNRSCSRETNSWNSMRILELMRTGASTFLLRSERNDICLKVGNHQAGKYKGVQWGQHDKAENFAWFDSRSGGVQTAQQIYEESVAGGEPSACYVAGFKYARENSLPAPPDPRDYEG